MTSDQAALWQQIRDFSIDPNEPVGLSFAARLARENGWTRDFAERAIVEYKRFVFLAMAAGHPVCPSEQVDQVWHLHLTYTRSYWDKFCKELLGRPLHHDPTRGGPAEAVKHIAMYRQTLASYRRLFNCEPQTEFWPPSEIRFGEDIHERRVNVRKNWIVPKGPVRRWLATAGLAIAVIGFATGCVAPVVLGNGGIAGPYYLLLYLAVYIGAVAVGLMLRNKMRGPDTPVETDPELDAYDLALLSGGPPRVFDTAVVRMMEAGQLEFTPDGRLKRVQSTPFPEHPVESAITLAVVQGPMESLPMQEVRKKVKFELEPNKDRLREQGLLLTESASFRASSVPFFLVLAVVLGLGVTRIVTGLENNKPSCFLMFLTFVSFAVSVGIFARLPRRTIRGDLYLKERLARPRVITNASGYSEMDLVMGTALLGTIVLAGTTYASLRTALYPKGVDSGTGGCSSGCGAGCGAGGGGCGGGGCGGCGGGD
jgi:uncharacterized protein (TIGR04222 family)